MDTCSMCDGHMEYLGTLGNLAHFRCRNCHWQDSEMVDDEPDEDFDSIELNSFDDGEALASAGYGTDEDYGGPCEDLQDF